MQILLISQPTDITNSPGVFGTDAAGVRRRGRDVRVRNAARFHAQR